MERILEKDPITGTKISCHIWIKTINKFFHLILQTLISIRDFCLRGFVFNLTTFLRRKELQDILGLGRSNLHTHFFSSVSDKGEIAI